MEKVNSSISAVVPALKMQDAKTIVEAMSEGGINFVVYMPDSFFFEILSLVKDDPRFTSLSVSNEGTGVSVCAGAWLGGKKPVMIMENTGFFLCQYALLRCHQAFGIPLLMLMSYRGDSGDSWWFTPPLGQAFEPSMKALSIQYEVVDDPQRARKAIVNAQGSLDVSEGLRAVVFRKGADW